MYLYNILILLVTVMMQMVTVNCRKVIDFCTVHGNGSMTQTELMPSINAANGLLAEVGLMLNPTAEIDEDTVRAQKKRELGIR